MFIATLFTIAKSFLPCSLPAICEHLETREQSNSFFPQSPEPGATRYYSLLCLPHPVAQCQAIRYGFYMMLLLTHEASIEGFLVGDKQ